MQLDLFYMVPFILPLILGLFRMLLDKLFRNMECLKLSILMSRTCSKLGTRLIYAKPYAAESKGKVEKFNRTVDSFLSEVVLEKPSSLDRLNELFQVWLSGCYQNKPLHLVRRLVRRWRIEETGKPFVLLIQKP